MIFFSNSIKYQLQCILFLAIILQPSFEYFLSGNTLTDLTSTTGPAFAGEAGSWYLSSSGPAGGQKYYLCGSTYILGGYQVLGGAWGQYYWTKYTSLPYHNQINLTMTIYALDQWDAYSGANDYFTISFDGIELYGFAIFRYGGAVSYLCGAPTGYDYPPFTMKVTIPHIDSELTLRLTGYLTDVSSSKSLGFRDIRIDLVYQDEPETTVCGISPQSLPDKPCPCSATNQYMSPIRSGTCVNCHPRCATCSGGSSSECLSCPVGNTYFKDFQCLDCHSTCATCDGGASNQCTSCIANYFMVEGSCYPTCDSPLSYYEISDITYCKTPCPNQYAYWDSTCSTACPYPLLPMVVSSLSLCTFPCAANQYLYWNRTCSNRCDPPYEIVVENTRSFCVYPCTASEYVYWDNTCEATCAPPLVKYSMGSPIKKDFCAYPCDNYKYLYWNGICSDTCEAPLVARVDHDRQFCTYPCLLTKYLYFNGSCLDSCPSPFSLRVEDARSYCDYGCVDTLEYLYWNGECGPCEAPLVRRIEAGRKFCDFQCSTSDFVYWDGSCETTCAPPLTQDPQGNPVTRYFCTYPCQSNDFLFWNGTCSGSCAFPFIQRTYKGKKFCDFPCDVSEYSYWNGTCQSNCPLPFLNRFEGNPTRKYCDYPCLDSEYMFWNLTCGACEPPLIRRVTSGKDYCDYPCQDDEYLYWEGSCNSTCGFPLREDIQGEIITKKFCHFPCLETQYLYWNGTCSYYCDFPYIIGGEYDRMTCNYPCLVDEYLYYNGTCKSACTLPLSYRNESKRNYCDYPCKNYEFLAWDGTCLDFCDFPYVTLRYDGLQFCRLPCYDSEDYFYFPDSMLCNETCTYPYYNDTQLPYVRCYPPVNPDYGPDFLEAPMNPGTVSFITLSKMMQYLRYLNVELPPRVERLALSKGRPILSTMAGIQPGEEILKFFGRSFSLNQIYSKHDLKQSFLANYWDTLTTFLIFALAGIVLWIFENFLHAIGFQRWGLLLERFRVVMKFNFPIMILAFSIDEIILYAALEFKTLSSRSYSSVSSTVSFLVCLIFVLSIPGLAYLTYYIIKRNRFYEAQAARPNQKPKDKGEGRIRDGYRALDVKKIRFESFQVLYRGFKEDNIFNQMFFSIYMMRIGLPIIIAISCENKPLVSCFLQLLVSVGIVNYLFWMKPFKKQVNYYQVMIYEVGVLLLNVCVGLMTLIRVTNSSYPLASKALATSVLAGNGLLNLLLLVFLVIKCVMEFATIWKEMDKQGIQGVRKGIAFLQVPFLYLQEGNMGFEEIMNYQPYSQIPKRRAIFAAQAITENSFLNYESFRGLETSHRDLNVSYTDQSTIIEAQQTKPDIKTETEDDSVIALPALPSPKNLDISAQEIETSPQELEITPREIEQSEPIFEEISRPRKKSLVLESPSKERKEWEEETVPKIKREGIKRKPLRKQVGGLDFRTLNF